MKRVKIDWNEIEGAFEFASYELPHYLDTVTGEVILLTEDGVEDYEQVLEQVEADAEGRYLEIPVKDSSEGYRDMEHFIETVRDLRLRDLLEVAINGRGAFRRFKDVLLSYPEERERWFAFERERLVERIREWLQAEEIEPIE
jgi:hypothetical protein